MNRDQIALITSSGTSLVNREDRDYIANKQFKQTNFDSTIRMKRQVKCIELNASIHWVMCVVFTIQYNTSPSITGVVYFYD